MIEAYCIGGSLDGQKKRASLPSFRLPVWNGWSFDSEYYELRQFCAGEGHPVVAFFVLWEMDDLLASSKALGLYGKATGGRI